MQPTTEPQYYIDDRKRTWRHRLARFFMKTLLGVRPCEMTGVELRQHPDTRELMGVRPEWHVHWWATENDVRRRLRHSQFYCARFVRRSRLGRIADIVQKPVHTDPSNFKCRGVPVVPPEGATNA